MIQEKLTARSALINDAVTLGECQMKSVYERANLIITEFDTDDVIITSGTDPTESVETLLEKDNRHVSFGTFDNQPPGGWF